MNSACIPETGYFGTPEFLSLASHLNTIVATPVHIFGMYCILFKTPEQMKTVKRYLLNLHIWISCFDYSFGILTVPFMLLPKFGGFPLGLLRYFGVSTLIQCLIVTEFFINMVISIVAVFENRFYILSTFRWMPFWRRWRTVWLVLYYLAGSLILIILATQVPEQSESKRKILESLPCLPSYIYEAPVFVLAVDFTPHVAAVVTFVVSACFIVLFFVISLAYNTIQQLKSHKLSQATFRLQRNFFISLVIQMEVPLLMFVIPLIYAFVSMLDDYYNQTLTNIAVMFVSMHGLVATFVMIMVHRPYRVVLFDLFRKINKKRESPQRVLSYVNSPMIV